MNPQNKLATSLWAFALTLLLSLGASFLYAAVAKDVWGWFFVPLAPTVLSPISYPMAYGLVAGASVFHDLVRSVHDVSPKDDDEENPMAKAFIKQVAKVVAVLILWAFVLVVHVVIGG